MPPVAPTLGTRGKRQGNMDAIQKGISIQLRSQLEGRQENNSQPTVVQRASILHRFIIIALSRICRNLRGNGGFFLPLRAIPLISRPPRPDGWHSTRRVHCRREPQLQEKGNGRGWGSKWRQRHNQDVERTFSSHCRLATIWSYLQRAPDLWSNVRRYYSGLVWTRIMHEWPLAIRWRLGFSGFHILNTVELRARAHFFFITKQMQERLFSLDGF